MSNSSNLGIAVGELSQTTDQVSDAVAYCNGILENFIADDKGEVVPQEVKECVQGAMTAVVEHVNATGQQVLIALQKQESDTEEILQVVERCGNKIKDLKTGHY